MKIQIIEGSVFVFTGPVHQPQIDPNASVVFQGAEDTAMQDFISQTM